MRVCDFNDRLFKIPVLKKLNKMQENSNKHFSELRSKINEQNKYFKMLKQTNKKTKNSEAEKLKKQKKR